MPDNDLGTVLTVLRVIRGLNQEELAQRSGLRAGTISDYERGKMVPGFNTAQRLLENDGVFVRSPRPGSRSDHLPATGHLR
jgi:transcriptional regulator with XRE-family HTH domain